MRAPALTLDGRAAPRVAASALCSPYRMAKDKGFLMHSLITSRLVQATRQLVQRSIWMHAGISQTFSCRPRYQASFKNAWLSFMWGGEADTRRLREAMAVAISAA